MRPEPPLGELIEQERVIVNGALRRPGDASLIESYRVLDRPLPELVQELLMRGSHSATDLSKTLGVRREDIRKKILDLIDDQSLIAHGYIVRRTGRAALPDQRRGTEFLYRILSIPLPLRVFDPILGLSLLGWLNWVRQEDFVDDREQIESDDAAVRRVAQWWNLPIDRVAEALAANPHTIVTSCIGPLPILDDPRHYRDGAHLFVEEEDAPSPVRVRRRSIESVMASIEGLVRARSFSVPVTIPIIISLSDALAFYRSVDDTDHLEALGSLNRALFDRFFKGEAACIPSPGAEAVLGGASKIISAWGRSTIPAITVSHTWSGNGATEPGSVQGGVAFPAGFVRCVVKRQGDAGTASLLDESGRTVKVLTQGIGAEEETHFAVLRSPTTVHPGVDASGPWELSVEEWPGREKQKFPWCMEGIGKEVTEPIILHEGMMLLEVQHTGVKTCMLDLISKTGRSRSVYRKRGDGAQTLPLYISDRNDYVFDVWADGPWSLALRKVKLGFARDLPREYRGRGNGVTKLFRPRLSSFALTISFGGNGPHELFLHNAENGVSGQILAGSGLLDQTLSVLCIPGALYLMEIKTDGIWGLAMTDDDPEESRARAPIFFI